MKHTWHHAGPHVRPCHAPRPQVVTVGFSFEFLDLRAQGQRGAAAAAGAGAALWPLHAWVHAWTAVAGHKQTGIRMQCTYADEQLARTWPDLNLNLHGLS